jgi:NAD(P)H-flavin reductase
VRFGSNITPEQALEFSDHIILSMGAGAPRTLNIEGRTAIGVRQASDFLMALQLTNAYHPDSLANLQISLPIVVIGGGLTAIDTATEALAYYPLQIEKFLSRYEALLQHHSESKIRHGWNQSMHNMADTWLEHAKILRQVQARGEETLPYLQQWGGCTVMYRKDWQQAPSYIRNHEEVNKALEEGIILTSNHNPTAFISDDDGYVQQIITNQGNYAASTILIAAGTQPNTTLSEEYPALFHKDTNGYFSSKYWQDDKFSTLGDLHPEYSGSVVKAIASAKYGAKSLHTNLQRSNTSVSKTPPQQHELEAEIITINELVDNVYEIGVRSPYAAKNFKAGQFFRLQNYFANAPYKRNTLMAMEGIAVGGCRVVDDVIYTVVRNKGGSTALIPYLKSGEKVIFMGPLGQPIATHTTGKKYLLVGNIAKSTILCAVAKALYLDNEVHHLRSFAEGKPYYQRLYLEYSTRADLFIDEKLLWQQLQSLDLSYYDYIITVGDNRLIRGVADIAPNKTIVLAGMNSPMQCMMKKICSQCLQEVVCKKTGEKKLEYSCFKQIQDARMVNFQALNNRMRQNEVQESIMRQWLAL